jgi:hypothetical protein
VGSIEVAFDDMAGPVIVRVESGRPGTSTAASFPVTDLIGWFGDHHDDAAVTQVTADRARKYALSPRTRSGRFLGRPGPARSIRSWLRRWLNMGESLAWSGPVNSTNGLAFPSTRARIFVDNPPRERPIA